MLRTNVKEDPTGLRNLQNVWNHYKPVAHFWAAWEMFGYPDMLDPDDFVAVISLSQLIRAWGEEYKPLKAERPMLSGGDVFWVPDEWVMPLRFDLLLRDVDLDEEAKARLFL